MKAIALIIGGVVGLILVVVAIKSLSPEDTWNCQQGQWVKHGNPILPKPVFPCPVVTPSIISTPVP
jgi:L-lactate permease